MLTEVAEWRASAAEWEYIAKLVDALTLAVSGNDADAVRDAVGELDLASPLRIPAISKGSKDLPPEKLRERVNRLIHTLGPRTGPTTTGTSAGTTEPAK